MEQLNMSIKDVIINFVVQTIVLLIVIGIFYDIGHPEGEYIVNAPVGNKIMCFAILWGIGSFFRIMGAGFTLFGINILFALGLFLFGFSFSEFGIHTAIMTIGGYLLFLSWTSQAFVTGKISFSIALIGLGTIVTGFVLKHSV